jgi:glycerate kinase
VVGLGGSATVDGGGGLATALGARLLRADGNGVKVGGRWIGETTRVAAAPPLGVTVIAASDVTNPLLGPNGAAAVFGPQKGADPEAIALLEQGLAAYAAAVERDLPGGPWRDLPGAGAAGGLGFGLLAFAGAGVVAGAEAVAGLVGLERALEGADLALTGEGALDAQSAGGKAPMHVLARGRAAGARVLAVAGRVADGLGADFDAVAQLGPEGMIRPAELVEQRATELAREV